MRVILSVYSFLHNWYSNFHTFCSWIFKIFKNFFLSNFSKKKSPKIFLWPSCPFPMHSKPKKQIFLKNVHFTSNTLSIISNFPEHFFQNFHQFFFLSDIYYFSFITHYCVISKKKKTFFIKKSLLSLFTPLSGRG